MEYRNFITEFLLMLRASFIGRAPRAEPTLGGHRIYHRAGPGVVRLRTIRSKTFIEAPPLSFAPGFIRGLAILS
jgi:hypothetical protein